MQLVATTRVATGLGRLGWGARITGRCVDAAEAQAATGVPGTGAEALLGDGDFLVVLGGEVSRFQAAIATGEEVERTVGLLAACAAARTEAAAQRRPAPGDPHRRHDAAGRRLATETARAGEPAEVRLLATSQGP